MATQPQQKPPDLNFDLSTPQINNLVFVQLDVSDDSRLLGTRLTLLPVMARQFAQALLLAAEKAEQQLVKPMGLISEA